MVREIANKTKLFILVAIALIFLTCEHDKTPLQTGAGTKLTLSLEDVTCTEAWLRLTVDELPVQAGIRLLRNDSIVYNEPLTSGDTLLYDSGLLPNAGYRYRALLTKNGKELSQSPVVSVQTMDTTSHELQWEVFTFGGYSGDSYLLDAAIVNDNNIWAAGKIDGDSLNPRMDYNAVHWNGQQWELKRLLYGGNFWTIRTVYAFSENDITFASFIHWDGTHFVQMPIPEVLMGWGSNTIWGTSSRDYYMAGDFGTIAHYNGTTWQKLESGTETPIVDMWGSRRNGKTVILAAVSTKEPYADIKLLSISPGGVHDTLQNGLTQIVYSVWFNENSPIYIAGDGLREFKKGRWQEVPIPPYFTHKIRGTAINNIFVLGAFDFVAHFNGMNWHYYTDFPLSYGALVGVAVTENLVVIVGDDGRRAAVVVGRRVR
ncbi:MAG: hypothetical protein P8184_16300 [Calditrichia bacterium]